MNMRTILQSVQTPWSERIRIAEANGFVQQEMQQNMEGTGDQQQQQQQQQQPADPFAGVDMDLLDDSSKTAITNARAELTRLNDLAKQASSHQSRADQLQSLLKQKEDSLQQLQSQHQQKVDTTKEPTLEDEIVAELVANGIPAEHAKGIAKVQVPILNKFAARTQRFVDSRVAPVANTVAMQNTTAVFEDLMHQSEVAEALQGDGALAQQVWDKLAQFTESGGEVTQEIAENLAIITAFKAGKQALATPSLPLQTRQPMHQQQQQQQTTRFTFPGAGHRPAPTSMVTRGNRPTLDADTAAAIAATTAAMKNYGGKGTQVLPKISRG